MRIDGSTSSICFSIDWQDFYFLNDEVIWLNAIYTCACIVLSVMCRDRSRSVRCAIELPQ